MSDKIVFKGEADDHWEMKVRPDGYDPRFNFQITDEDMCGFDVGNDEAVRLAIALIQATPEDDAERAHVEVDPVGYAIALIRAAGQK